MTLRETPRYFPPHEFSNVIEQWYLISSKDHDSSDVISVASDSSANSNSILQATRNYMECCLFQDEARSISHSNNSDRRAVPFPSIRRLATDRLTRVHSMPKDIETKVLSSYLIRFDIITTKIVEKILKESVEISAYRRTSSTKSSRKSSARGSIHAL